MATTEPLQPTEVHPTKTGEPGVGVPHREPYHLRDATTHSRGGLKNQYPTPRVFAVRGSMPESSVFSYSEAKTNALSDLTAALALVPASGWRLTC